MLSLALLFFFARVCVSISRCVFFALHFCVSKLWFSERIKDHERHRSLDEMYNEKMLDSTQHRNATENARTNKSIQNEIEL